jgi:hypothetical protein
MRALKTRWRRFFAKLASPAGADTAGSPAARILYFKNSGFPYLYTDVSGTDAEHATVCQK